eukprot:1654564-Pleurochrysis_carterae.AAC.3
MHRRSYVKRKDDAGPSRSRALWPSRASVTRVCPYAVAHAHAFTLKGLKGCALAPKRPHFGTPAQSGSQRQSRALEI